MVEIKVNFVLGKKQGQQYFNQKHPDRKIYEMIFVEMWKTSTDTFQKEPKVTNKSFKLFGRKKSDNEGMAQFCRALRDLTRASDFGDPEASIDRDVFIFNMKNEEIKKQLCMETMSPGRHFLLRLFERDANSCIGWSVAKHHDMGKTNLTVIAQTL